MFCKSIKGCGCSLSNSKASYLPRQSREKLNIDPDHGIYKRTLNSNEDHINHNNAHHHQHFSPHGGSLFNNNTINNNHSGQHPHQQHLNHHQHHLQQQHNNNNIINNTVISHHPHKSDILATKCNNLPDLLPMGAKVHNTAALHPVSRYGSNNNINMNHHSAPAKPLPPPYQPFHHQNHNNGHHHHQSSGVSAHLRPANGNQSTPLLQNHINSIAYNLKPAFILSRHSTASPSAPGSPMAAVNATPPPQQRSSTGSDSPTIELRTSPSPVTASDAASSAESPTNDQRSTASETPSTAPQRQSSPPTMASDRSTAAPHRQRAGIYAARQLSLDELHSPVGRAAAPAPADQVLAQPLVGKITRKESLKENIDKITQLQTQLMSSHIHDSAAIVSPAPRVDSALRPRMSPIQRADSMPASPRTPQSPMPSSPVGLPTRQSPVQHVVATGPPPQPPQVACYSEASSQTDESALCAAAAALAAATLNGNSLDASTATSLSDLTAESDDDDDGSAKRPVVPAISSAALQLDCQKLVDELLAQLSPGDRLQHVFAPTAHRSAAFYVTGLYNPYVTPRAGRRDVGTSTPSESPSRSKTSTPVYPASGAAQPTTFYAIAEPDVPPPVPTTPPPTMTRFTRAVATLMDVTCDGHDCDGAILAEPAPPTAFDLIVRAKEQLIERLQQIAAVLTQEQTVIADETAANEQLGQEVGRNVAEKIRALDVSKFRSYVDDVGHITMLLLSLSGRLARTEDELQIVDVSDADRKMLEIKRDRLVEQLDEAKRLKEDIDRRGSVVCRCLEQNLSMDAYADYDYYVNMKAKLIVDARETSDKLKLIAGQLAALKETLVHSEC